MDRPKLTPQYHEHDTGQDLDSGAGLRHRVHRPAVTRDLVWEEREAAEELMPLEFPPAPRKNTVSSPGWGRRTNSR